MKNVSAVATATKVRIPPNHIGLFNQLITAEIEPASRPNARRIHMYGPP